MLGIKSCVPSDIAYIWKAFGVHLPAFTLEQDFTDDVINANGAGETVVVGNDLTCRHHEIVANRRMRIAVVVRGKPILIRKRV